MHIQKSTASSASKTLKICSELRCLGHVLFSWDLHLILYNFRCQMLRIITLGILLRDLVDLVPWTFIILLDLVDQGSSNEIHKILGIWDPQDLMRSPGSVIRSWVSQILFVLSWDPGDLGSWSLFCGEILGILDPKFLLCRGILEILVAE